MKLTDEERNSLVILQLEKAKVFLKQADEMFDLKLSLIHIWVWLAMTWERT